MEKSFKTLPPTAQLNTRSNSYKINTPISIWGEKWPKPSSTFSVTSLTPSIYSTLPPISYNSVYKEYWFKILTKNSSASEHQLTAQLVGIPSAEGKSQSTLGVVTPTTLSVQCLKTQLCVFTAWEIDLTNLPTTWTLWTLTTPRWRRWTSYWVSLISKKCRWVRSSR